VLPFLKRKQETAVSTPIVKHMSNGDTELAPMRKAIRSLIEAIESKDESAAEAAFKECFQCCESAPHEEAEPTEESEQE